MTLFEELIAVTQDLETAGVEYALAGGLAVAVWGAPRATKDIDLLIREESVDDALRVVARRGFDERALLMKFRDGMTVQRVSRVVQPDVLTIDFMFVNDTLVEVWKSRRVFELSTGALTVVSREGLIAMKTLAGRAQDLADIERLRELDR